MSNVLSHVDPALSIGVVGYGHMGKVYVDILQNVFAVTNLSVADPLLSSSGSFRAYSSYEDLAQCDVVIIAHPTELHAKAVEFFSEKAKALLIEKPLGLTYEESRQIVSTVERSGLTAMCGLTGLYHPEFRAMYALAPKIGELKQVREILHEASPELQIYLQNQRGVLAINGIHTLHRFWKIAHLLLSAETLHVERVSLESGAFPGSLGENRATGILKLASATFQFDVAYLNGRNCVNGWPIEYVVEIEGTNGTIRVTGWERCESVIGGRHEVAYEHPDGPLRGTSQYPRIRLGAIEQVRDFLQFFRDGGRMHSTLEEALQAQFLLEQCYAAAGA